MIKKSQAVGRTTRLNVGKHACPKGGIGAKLNNLSPELYSPFTLQPFRVCIF